MHGHVAPWYLKPKQASVLHFLRQTDDPFFEASRRFGKTNTVLAYVIEESIRRENIITRWCEPWKNQCREIVMTEMDQIQSQIPVRYRFKWHGTDSYYHCPWNGSRIYLRGMNDDRGESARGPKAHIIVADELGSWREPIYAINEVLLPQLLTTRGKLIKCGTPPRLLIHQFYTMKKKAMVAGKYIQRLVHDQELVEWDQIEKIVAEMGGWDSPAVRREMLCEEMPDPKFSIIPEWKDEFIQAVPQDEFFPFYFKYDGIDTGVRDLTVILLAYYDFRLAKLVVIDEIVMNGPQMTTEKLAEANRAKEAEHWGIKWETFQKEGKTRWRAIAPHHTKIRRVSDIDLLFINDMSSLHGLYYEATDKGELEEMVNQVRIWTGAGRILVHPRCEILIDSMRYGVWNEKRKEWERDERLGHFDAIAALMYLLRNVDHRTNPIPMDYGKPAEQWFFSKEPDQKRDKLKQMFNVKR